MGKLADIIDEMLPKPPGEGEQIWVEGFAMDLPFEIYVRASEDNTVSLDASLPSQTFETSLMPVFHRVKLRIVAE
jgi:hypothetical protein